MQGFDFTSPDNVSQAVNGIVGARRLPQGFFERGDGIVAPERIREAEPRILIAGHVDEEMFRRISNDLDAIEGRSQVLSHLQVRLASPGGSVDYGFGIYDLLTTFARSHNIPMTVTGYGPVLSMGALLIQVGDVRQMPRTATLLLHPIQTGYDGSPDYISAKIRQSKASMHTYAQILSNRVERTGRAHLSPDEIIAYMKAEDTAGTYFTAQQAYDVGLIDVVI